MFHMRAVLVAKSFFFPCSSYFFFLSGCFHGNCSVKIIIASIMFEEVFYYRG